MIIIGVGSISTKRHAEAINLLHSVLNPKTSTSKFDEAAARPYEELFSKNRTSSYLFLKNVQETNTINNAWLQHLALKSTNDNWYFEQIEQPKTIAYALALSNLKRNTDAEKILDAIVKKYPDPMKRTVPDDSLPVPDPVKRATIDELTAYKYTKMAYHLIWYAYVEKHSLQTTLTYDAPMKKTILTYLNTPLTTKTTTTLPEGLIPDGIYLDLTNQELGYIDNNGVPNGCNLVYLLVEAIYFTEKYYDFSHLRTIAESMFDRVGSNFRNNFVRLVGSQHTITHLDYLANWLQCMGQLYKINKSFNVGADYYKQLAKLSHNQRVHYFYTDLPKQGTSQPKTIRSTSEGFFYVGSGNFDFEVACSTPYHNNEIVSYYSDDLKFNRAKLQGYLNYGCDFSSVFSTYNIASDNDNFLLSGQYIITDGEVFQTPKAAAVVPILNNLYYVCHDNNAENVQAHGILDVSKRVHKYSIKSAVAINYCVFAWASDYYISATKINDSTWVMYDSDTSFKIQVDETFKLTYEPLSLLGNGTYVKFTVALDAGGLANVTISQTPESVQLPPMNFGVPADVTVLPEGSKALSYFEANNSVYVVYSELGSQTPAIAAVRDTVNYPFSKLSMGHFAQLPKI